MAFSLGLQPTFVAFGKPPPGTCKVSLVILLRWWALRARYVGRRKRTMLRIAAIMFSLIGLTVACLFLRAMLATIHSPAKPELFAAERLDSFSAKSPYIVVPFACAAALLLVDRARRHGASALHGSATRFKPHAGRFAIGIVASIAVVAVLVILSAFIFPTGEGERLQSFSPIRGKNQPIMMEPLELDRPSVRYSLSSRTDSCVLAVQMKNVVQRRVAPAAGVYDAWEGIRKDLPLAIKS